MNRSRPTMKDVAQVAGVSVKTVSRVVNNERWVTPEVVGRVNEAIAELGYRMDARARSLRNVNLAGRTIGFIHAELANPFFTAVHSGVEEVATAAGCMIVTASSGESVERQEAVLRNFVSRRVDGLIVVPAGDSTISDFGTAELDREILAGMPVVFVDREHTAPTDFVSSDSYGGAAAAAEHLIAHGHQEIAYLGDMVHLYSARYRQLGFTEKLTEHGLQPNAAVTSLATAEQAFDATHRLMAKKDRPTALFTAKNLLSAGAIQALHQLGLQHEVALVGFDEVPMGTVIEPGISEVPQDAPELGRIAGRLLLERINDERVDIKRVIVPVGLVSRGSGEIPGPNRSSL